MTYSFKYNTDRDRDFENLLIPFSGEMHPEQLAALTKLLNDRESDYFVTGGAGTGKSFLVKILRSVLPIAVCSTTGMSSIAIGGCTVDRMFNFSRETWAVRNQYKLQMIMRSLPHDILIDEISMAGLNMSNLIYDIARRYNKRLILVGDMAQASPVKDGWGTKSNLFKHCKQIKLEHCHRQSDEKYLIALNLIRRGIVNDVVRKEFAQCVDVRNDCPDHYVRLFGTNALAAEYNSARINRLPDDSPIVKLVAEYEDLRKDSEYPITEGDAKRAFDSARLGHDEYMRIGARVLIGINNDEEGYVNGDAGVVVNILTEDGASLLESTAFQVAASKISTILVRLDRNNNTVSVNRAARTIIDAQRTPVGIVRGFPLMLGWAHTIHKAQGMTLRFAYVGLESIVNGFKDDSKHGLAYVALSRTTSIQGLRIDRWVDEAVFCSKEVADFV